MTFIPFFPAIDLLQKNKQMLSIMKKVLFILILLVSFSQLRGQTKASRSFLMNYNRNIPSYIKANRLDRNLSLKSYLVARHEYKQISTNKYTPNLSVDLLDGKGIHLFSISNMGLIPKMNIGARITAGIKISI